MNILIEKGIITADEAQKVRAQVEARRTNMADLPPIQTPWQLSKAVKRIELFGDVRLRYEDRLGEDPDGGHIRMQRFRYALRVGLRGELFDDYYFGFRMETATSPRSSWVTAGTSSSGVPYQGPFGKSTAGINLSQAYVGWKHDDWIEITAGKMPNPLYTSSMVWDGDISPEGLAERFKHKIGNAEFFATFGQFIYQDTNPTDYSEGYFGLNNNLFPSGSGGNTHIPILLTWQGGFTYRFNKDMSLKVAPILHQYMGRGENTTLTVNQTSPGFPGSFVGQGATNNTLGHNGYWSGYPSGVNNGFNANQTGINDLLVLEFPWEFNFKVWGLNGRVFGDYAYNLQGRERAEAAYLASQPGAAGLGVDIQPIPSVQDDDITAYQVGFAIGNGTLGLVSGAASKKHSWEARVAWQHVEQYALDPNLLDSDWFTGAANMEGIFGAVAYGFTENFIGVFRFGYAHRINDKLGTGGSNSDLAQMNPIDYYQLMQLDLTVRF